MMLGFTERELLARIIQCEAGGEGDTGYDGKAGAALRQGAALRCGGKPRFCAVRTNNPNNNNITIKQKNYKSFKFVIITQIIIT